MNVSQSKHSYNDDDDGDSSPSDVIADLNAAERPNSSGDAGQPSSSAEQQDVEVAEPTFCGNVCLGIQDHWSLLRDHFLAFYATNMIVSVATAIFSTLIPISLREMKETDTVIGLVLCSPGLSRMVLEVPTSYLSSYLGPRMIMCIGTVIVTVVVAMPAMQNSVYVFAAAAAISGVGVVFCNTPRHELLQHAFSSSNKKRTRVAGHMGAIGRVSYMIGPSVGGAIYHEVSPAAAYLTACGICATLLIVLMCSSELSQLDAAITAEEDAKRKKSDNALLDEGSTNRGEHKQQQRNIITRSYPSSRLPSAAAANDDKEQYLIAQSEGYEDEKDDALSDLDTDSVSSKTANNNSTGGVMMRASVTVDSPAPSASSSHRTPSSDSLCPLIAAHWKEVFIDAGVIALTVMAVRQARRLAITLRALDEGMSAKAIGLLLALSFSVDFFMFWLCSILSNKWGYRAALAPLLFFYAVALGVLSLTHLPWTLYLALPLFGIGDAFGAGIILALLSNRLPRKLIGTGRLLGVDLGTVVGPLLTGGLSHALGVSKMCYVMAGWSLLVSVVTVFHLGTVGKAPSDEK